MVMTVPIHVHSTPASPYDAIARVRGETRGRYAGVSDPSTSSTEPRQPTSTARALKASLNAFNPRDAAASTTGINASPAAASGGRDDQRGYPVRGMSRSSRAARRGDAPAIHEGSRSSGSWKAYYGAATSRGFLVPGAPPVRVGSVRAEKQQDVPLYTCPEL